MSTQDLADSLRRAYEEQGRLRTRAEKAESDLTAAQELVRELEAELAELRDRVQSVIERGPRFTDGPMESAADSVVEELRAVLPDKGQTK